MKMKRIKIGTRVIRLSDYRRKSGVGGPVRGTVTAVVRDICGGKASEVRWDAGGVQLCSNADLRIVS
jgi:hypothetical protein